MGYVAGMAKDCDQAAVWEAMRHLIRRITGAITDPTMKNYYSWNPKKWKKNVFKTFVDILVVKCLPCKPKELKSISNLRLKSQA